MGLYNFFILYLRGLKSYRGGVYIYIDVKKVLVLWEIKILNIWVVKVIGILMKCNKNYFNRKKS